jgi:cytochrome c biogenesis protein CcmG/thiol:disulfide interchange protein DsbE
VRFRLPILLVCVALLACACTRSSGTTLGLASVDRPFPDLHGATVQGGEMSAADLAGKVAVVNFWATWCAPCEREQPALQRAWEAYKDKGVAFVGVNARDNDAAARAWIERFGVTYPSVVDEAGAWADDFGFVGLPDTYVVDASGTIRYQITGATTQEQLSGVLDQLLASPAPPS